MAGVAVSLAVGDHPRMRGEHLYAHCKKPCHTGSSPHARGAPFLSLDVSSENGIIPACAGSTKPAIW